MGIVASSCVLCSCECEGKRWPVLGGWSPRTRQLRAHRQRRASQGSSSSSDRCSLGGVGCALSSVKCFYDAAPLCIMSN